MLGHGSLLENNITLGGLSPLDPHVHCTRSGAVCQATLGESEINAAASAAALVLGADAAARFDWGRTYFLLSGVAGVNPKLGTLGSVALARFAVQAALQYELDARDMPANFSTGYLAYGTRAPGRPPTRWYGTEVLEVNAALRDAAFDLARNASGSGSGASHGPILDDDPAAAAYRAKYDAGADAYGSSGSSSSGGSSGVPKHENVYEAATGPPSVLRCDSVTSDNYYSGPLLSEAFENTTRVWTNQSQITYCMTAQEDSAVLQVLLRAHLARRADFSRAIVMRAGTFLSLSLSLSLLFPYVFLFPHLCWVSHFHPPSFPVDGFNRSFGLHVGGSAHFVLETKPIPLPSYPAVPHHPLFSWPRHCLSKLRGRSLTLSCSIPSKSGGRIYPSLPPPLSCSSAARCTLSSLPD